jgi:hypothetical protein
MIGQGSGTQLETLPAIARRAAARLHGSPSRIADPARDELSRALEATTGEALVRETYGLVCLARWLFQAGERQASHDVLDIADTASARLIEANEWDEREAEKDRERAQLRLAAKPPEKSAPRFGTRAAVGSISVAALATARPRRLA